MDSMNDLHGLVAQSLKDNLDDPKVLIQAIKFLKDNDITVDLVESSEQGSLADSIKKYVNTDSGEKTKTKMSVQDLMDMAQS